MSKPKVRKVYVKLLALLPIPFLLTGCMSDCKIEGRHVHKYVHADNRGTITNYLDNEQVKISYEYKVPEHRREAYLMYDHANYNWSSDAIEITKEDEEFYKVKGDLFDGRENWNYLFNIMLNRSDYIEYNYIWDDGEDKFSRWTSQYDWRDDHTGIIHVIHFRYFGYRIIKKDGKYVKEKSPVVDDIRDIIDEYPYFDLGCVTYVSKEYKLNPKDLKNLKLSDIDEFKQPNLTTTELHPNTK